MISSSQTVKATKLISQINSLDLNHLLCYPCWVSGSSSGFEAAPYIVQFSHHDWSEILVQEPIQDWTGASRAHADHVAHTKQGHQLRLRLRGCIILGCFGSF